MPFDFAELAVENLLHVDAQTALVDLKLLPINEKPSIERPAPDTEKPEGEITVEFTTAGCANYFESKDDLSLNSRVVAVDFVSTPSVPNSLHAAYRPQDIHILAKL